MPSAMTAASNASIIKYALGFVIAIIALLALYMPMVSADSSPGMVATHAGANFLPLTAHDLYAFESIEVPATITSAIIKDSEAAYFANVNETYVNNISPFGDVSPVKDCNWRGTSVSLDLALKVKDHFNAHHFGSEPLDIDINGAGGVFTTYTFDDTSATSALKTIAISYIDTFKCMKDGHFDIDAAKSLYDFTTRNCHLNGKVYGGITTQKCGMVKVEVENLNKHREL